MQQDWEEFVRGDNESLGRLYRPLFRPMLLIAVYFLKDKDKAQDVVQGIFYKIINTTLIERKEKWSNIRDIEAFLATMVRNKCKDIFELENNRKRLLKENYHPDSHTNIELNFEKSQLEMCIDRLPIKEQELIRLHLDGYKNQEIAEIHTISEKTVKNRLSITRSKLAGLWKNFIIIITILWGMK